MKKRLASLLPALALVLVLAAPADARAQTVLRLTNWLPQQHVIFKDVLQVWASQVEEATEGRVKIQVLPKPVANPGGTFDAVASGIAHVAAVVHGYSPGRFPLATLAEFSGTGETAEAASVAYQRIYERELAAIDQHPGVRTLAVFTNGPGYIFNTKRPIRTLDDLAGLRFRVGGGVVNDIADALGVAAVLKPANESYELVSAGVVDGVFFPTEPIRSFNLDRFIRYGTAVRGGLYNTSWALIMNAAAFDELSEEDRAAILSVSGEQVARLAGRAQDVNEEAAHEAIVANGVEMIQADEAFMKDLLARTRPLEDAWAKEVAKLGVDGAALLSAYRQELENAAASN
ncbi:TRAP transporter substrate-binding protein [Arenibaculum sp.]|jgi:TRAP-type C4-dicarboxylate transport system substrate-binding protein|uniref:TRAP transporter substrate-binding protein n=1 Tax=Arenibaculum sp. TaxID=2865862 RepID=UPI002E0D5D55|nr:TRAP transporter substrate-binding protein [Arenibaculum sp.]